MVRVFWGSRLARMRPAGRRIQTRPSGPCVYGVKGTPRAGASAASRAVAAPVRQFGDSPLCFDPCQRLAAHRLLGSLTQLLRSPACSGFLRIRLHRAECGLRGLARDRFPLSLFLRGPACGRCPLQRGFSRFGFAKGLRVVRHHLSGPAVAEPQVVAVDEQFHAQDVARYAAGRRGGNPLLDAAAQAVADDQRRQHAERVELPELADAKIPVQTRLDLPSSHSL